MSKKLAVVTIFLSVISTALWEGLIKPTTGWLLNFLLTLSTLGLEKFKDGIYRDIAKGLHEDISLQIYTTLSMFLLSFLIVLFLLTMVLKIKNYGSFWKKIFLSPKTLFDNNVFLTIYFVFAITFAVLDTVRITYVNGAVTYYNQLITVVSPDISTNEILNFNSRFAQITTKDEYVQIVGQLSDLLVSKNKKVPEKISFIF